MRMKNGGLLMRQQRKYFFRNKILKYRFYLRIKRTLHCTLNLAIKQVIQPTKT